MNTSFSEQLLYSSEIVIKKTNLENYLPSIYFFKNSTLKIYWLLYPTVQKDFQSLTHYLPVFSYDDRGSKFEFYIKKGVMKKFPMSVATMRR